MAVTMYKFYQPKGGNEEWVPIQAHVNLDTVRPTFVTVLAVDTLITKDTSKEDSRKAKYVGPMYFDIDSEDIQEAIDSGNELVSKLLEYELTEQDIQIFLSGKKGLHVIIPEVCFQEKPVPMQGLVQMYKEIALRFAVDALDFRVYTAGRGRQFRTCYNVRENGNYKVPVSLGELRGLTPEGYAELCKQPRSTPLYAPQWRAKFALVFDEAAQKVGKLKPRKAKPVTPTILKEGLSTFKKLATGAVKSAVGFNILAMQLALYARECRWAEDDFVAACSGVIDNHESDGSRYNSAKKRETELRRMFWYVEDNANLDFSLSPLRSCLPKVKSDVPHAPVGEDCYVDEQEFDEQSYAGVYREGNRYLVSKGEDGDQPISTFAIDDITLIHNLQEHSIYKISGRFKSNVKNHLGNVEVSFGPSSINSSSGVHGTFSKYGGAFLGNDTHARGLYNLMIREAKHNKFVITSEGINCFKFKNPKYTSDEPAREYTVWADRRGVVSADGLPFELVFVGDPDPAGLAKTDLTSAPDFNYYIENGEEDRVFSCLENLFNSHTPETMGKMIGWAVSCFYAPMFQLEQSKFPLLHVYGPAGSGKCLAKDTPVLMADGTTKLVQDVKAGEHLLSPSGNSQLVTNVSSGRERMWKVTPVKGDAYICNESHILSLKRSNRDGVRLNSGKYIPGNQEILNINVKEFYENPKLSKQFKGWRLDAPVEFHRKQEELPLDAYFLGAWLGDGRSSMAAINKPPCNLVTYCNNVAVAMGCTVTHHVTDKWGRCDEWSYVRTSGKNNPIVDALRKLGVLKGKGQVGSDNKHIPESYKLGSIETRKKLLAGLLDADGHTERGGYDFISKHKHLADDVAFMARSLGLAAYVTEVRKGIKPIDFVGTYYRVSISGDCTILPMLDKIPAQRSQIKRVTVTGITVEPLEEGDYYGFTLDGDHLFMLGDFTVTHNTETIRGLLRMFYHSADAMETSPNSSLFSIQHQMASTASIPLFVDEYKPHEMDRLKLNQMRALFRDAYNGKSIQRGGGNKNNKDDYNALNSLKMEAPVIFAAEAPETETAIVERSVMVSFKRLSGRAQANAYRSALAFYQDEEPLSSVGLELAQIALRKSSKEAMEPFLKYLAWANHQYLPSPDDAKLVEEGKLTEAQAKLRASLRPRNIFAATVALFGLQMLKACLVEHFGKGKVDERLGSHFKLLSTAVFLGMDALSAATIPEFLKVLGVMADMSKLQKTDPFAIVEGIDYSLSEIGGEAVLVLATAQAYRKYRAYSRHTGSAPLFPGEDAFKLALQEIPQFMKTGSRTQRLVASTVFLNLDDLYRAGCPAWDGKPVMIQ
jgi:hypothetical protein